MSIATTIRQQHEAKEHEQRQKANARYRQLVRTTATGKEAKFDQIEQAAAGAGKSVQDFANDVERQEKRIALAARLAAIPDKRTRRAEIQQALDTHNATLDEAIERHRQASEPLVSEANELDGAIEQADQLKQELVSTVDAETTAAIDAAGEEHFQADTAVRQAKEAISFGSGSQELLQRHAGKAGFDTQHHEQIVAAAKAAEAALPKLQQDLAAAESKYHAAQARQLEP